MAGRTPARSGEEWTPAEVGQLRMEAALGYTTERIARTHQRTEAAIRSEASREKITLEPDDRLIT